mgnify:FL=1
MSKRIFDLCLAGLAVLVLWPLMLLTALSVLLSVGRPVLFTQVRPGLHARPFRILKFRTMISAQSDDGTPLSDGDRLTRLGRLLRATSLDELPELFNVLRGDMSLVGPRPLLTEYLPLYSDEQARRHEVPPGITGWAQVKGRNALGWEEKFELDVWYVDNHSIWLDLQILWLTLAMVLKREGISHPGDSTMPKFKGNAP